MLRLRTNVTGSPTASMRNWSATAATSRKSGPRASSRVTISSTPTSSPASTPSSTSPTGVRARAVHPAGGAAGSNMGGATSPPADHASSRASPSRSDAHRTANRTSSCNQRSPSRTYSGYTVRRGASVWPVASVASRSCSRAGPGPLRVHVVGGDGRDAAPVVDAGGDERGEVVGVGQVGGRLQVDRRVEHQASGGDGPEEFVGRARGRSPHRRAGLGQEVLDDHLLHVTVTLVRRLDGEQRVEAFPAGLADAHEDAGGERHPGPTRGLERGQAAGGGLVGRTRVRPAGLAQAIGERLDHHPLRRRHRPQPGEVVLGERTGVGVGEQAGLGQHRRRRGHQVVDGGGVAARREPRGGVGVAVLGRLAEGEQRFVAAELGAATRDRQHLVELEVRRHEVRRGLGEGAVAALVAAQHRQGDEHLRREGDAHAVRSVASGGRARHEVGERGVEQRGDVDGRVDDRVDGRGHEAEATPQNEAIRRAVAG